jgi:hypothetical protein
MRSGLARPSPLGWLTGAALLGAVAISFAPGDLAASVARAALLATGLGVAAVWVRRGRPRPAARRLELLERVALRRDGEAVLLRFDGRTLLVGVGRDGLRLLAEGGAGGRERP